jgi:hypothetical protein
MAWFSKKVSVTLVDDASGATFATSDMPVDDLPDSFETATTLHLGDADWSVVCAEPKLKTEFGKTRKLTIRLRKIQMMDPKELHYSQLDITERFDDHLTLDVDDWITTTPLNTSLPDPESSGLPSVDADNDEVYRIAVAMSELRESVPLPDDGVYCPICHIANIDLRRLRTSCPKCGRDLLKFGWT